VEESAGTVKIAVVCAPGLGDALILHIVSHHLKLAGHDVITHTPHRFGKWLEGYSFGDMSDCDAIFLQHGNTPRDKEILQKNIPVYTFYGSHLPSKHGPLRPHLDFVADLNQTMVDNIIACLQHFFSIKATPDNGFRPWKGLIHRKYPFRIVIHAGSSDPFRNWHQFDLVATKLKKEGFEPTFLPTFPSLEQLGAFLYGSGGFLGNNSGPGHMASLFHIPHVILGHSEKHMRHWRPGWGKGKVLTPPRWIPNWKGFRIRETHWKHWISPNAVFTSLLSQCRE
jgi:hypothetical protein